ncbi:MAG: PilZ domain-containing protein [Acidobacteria bacterium]|nr:PilZ domain-containing protein [Acidobacteriota bacterium]
MAEAMLECAVCSARKWQSFEAANAEELRLAGATRLSCPSCNKDTYWTFAESDRRVEQDRRKQPEAPKPQQVDVPFGTDKVALQPPPDQEYFRREAVRLFQPPDRRLNSDRRQAPQRGHYRVPLRLPVRIRVSSSNLRFEEITSTINVCRTGILFHSTRPYAKGILAYVTMNYSPGDPATIEHAGTVVRVDSNTSSETKGVAIQLQ